MSDASPSAIGSERFVVERLLGEGGMGAVYEVFDREVGQRRALKVLRLDDHLDELRFRREFREVAGFHHPNLVRLFDLVQLPTGALGYTMELIDGGNLYDTLSSSAVAATTHPSRAPTSTPPPPRVETPRSGAGDTVVIDEPPPSSVVFEEQPAVERGAPLCDISALLVLLSQVLDALEALHERGVVHRDLKPDNILVDRDGRAKLVDFGIVERTTHGEALDPARRRGTAAFMAPELFAAKPATPAVDLYALGCTLYLLLSGEPPFTGTPAEVAAGHVMTAPLPIAARVRGVPAALASVCDDLLAKAPSRRPSIAEIRARLGLAGRGDGPRRTAPLVGREAAIAALSAALADARAGTPRAVLLTAPSGMGKSSLAEAFRAVAAGADALLVQGRCYERDTLPFRALGSCADDLALWLLRWPEAERATLADDAALVSPVFPGFSLLAQGRPSPTGAAARSEAFSAMRRIVAAVARRRPFVLVVDDMQWADGESVELLCALLASPPVGRLLVLALSRPIEVAGHPLESLASAPGASTLRLEPLDASASRRLFEALLAGAPSGSHDALVESAGGSPFLIEQLAITAAAHPELLAGGATIDRLVAARLDDLGADARSLLEVAAAVGAPARRRTLERAASLRGAFQPALDELLTRGLLHVAFLKGASEGQRLAYDLSHDAFRERVYGWVEPARRRELHGLLLAALERGGDAESEALLRHAEGAGDAERVRRYTVEAAREAHRRLSYERAAELYARALASLPAGAPAAERAELLLSVSQVHHALGDYPAVKRGIAEVLTLLGTPPPQGTFDELARSASLAAAQLLRRLGLAGERAEPALVPLRLRAAAALERLGEVFYSDNQPTAAVHASLLMLELCESCPPSPELARATGLAAATLSGLRMRPTADRYLAEATALAERTGDAYSMAAVATYANFVLLTGGALDQAIAHCERASVLYADSGDHERHIHALALGLAVRVLAGLAAPLRRDVERLQALAERHRDPLRLAAVALARGSLALREARLDDVERDIASVDTLLGSKPHVLVEAHRLALLGGLTRERGEIDASIASVRSLVALLDGRAGLAAFAHPLALAAETSRKLAAIAPRERRLAGDVTRALALFSLSQPVARPTLLLHQAELTTNRTLARWLARRAVDEADRCGLHHDLALSLALLARLSPPAQAHALDARARHELARCGVPV